MPILTWITTEVEYKMKFKKFFFGLLMVVKNLTVKGLIAERAKQAKHDQGCTNWCGIYVCVCVCVCGGTVRVP